MPNATPEALAKLSAVGQPAPFGRNDESVLDDTYRIAGKMNKTHFACKLDVEVPKILDIVRPILFNKEEEKDRIRTELYKFNVYEEGSSFKTHKYTPCSNTMIGLLLITYPTPHAGGTLILSKDDRSWSLDSGSPVHAAMELKYDEDRLREVVQCLLDDPDFLPLSGLMEGRNVFGVWYSVSCAC